MSDLGVHILPQPQELEVGTGCFRLERQARINLDPANASLVAIGEFLATVLRRATGWKFPLVRAVPGEPPAGSILLAIGDVDSDLGEEGYNLVATPDNVTVTAPRPAGVFYGVQTLRQLLPPLIEGTPSPSHETFQPEWLLPAVKIRDWPRFQWRGLLLDCCRHFMDVSFIKHTIDLLAYHKMNRFHWHLTEDQGWRLPSDAYPRLTEIGAWRTEQDGKTHGGYYTREDIREVVTYAARRCVQVVPEIEMPGHCVAALAAYPELSCREKPLQVENRWGIQADVFCAGNDATFEFLETILTEVMELFPSPTIHIGGDEVPKDRWRSCRRCQARMAAEGLADEDQLQSWFIRRIAEFLKAHGRGIVGWDEILAGGLAPGATVQCWRGLDGGVEAARLGHDAIMSPTSHAYFDYDIGKIDLRQAYAFDPVPESLSPEQSRHVLGGECNMWTEHTPQDKVDSMIYPRLLATSECLWTAPPVRDFAEFLQRVRSHYQRLDLLGVSYGPEAPTGPGSRRK